ncbi:MAG: hypothetical protein ACL9RN_00255 [Cylindrospermopsis raciborskii]|uniref:hypothetical protein n=1 Tax=Cylindrospermopsis raciborskii TaxID=77022 RepID=UPI003D0BFBA0
MRSPAKNSSPYYTRAGATPKFGLDCDRMAVTPVHLRSTRTCEIAQFFPGEKSVFSVGVFNSIGSPPTPLKKQGVFKVGGKKEKESDLLLIKFQKDHYFGFFKKC